MYKSYCTGCGLCASVDNEEIIVDKKGFRRIKNDKPTDFLSQVCPVSGKQSADLAYGKIWGKEEGVFLSYSTDTEIRHSASSGGALTALCLYLLDNKLVDGIVHTGANPDKPIDTKTFLSTTREEVISKCGSRYSSSTPLADIKPYLNDNKTYAYVGKPCEITALRNLAKTDERIDKTFTYMFSFFCAGAPSENANLELLSKMGVTLDECTSLRYRGDGWPGYATAVDKNGKSHKIEYKHAWGDTLGRDIRLICRFCLDGIGEQADISACDAWYLDENKRPVFEEADGRNAIFCRNKKGLELYQKAVEQGYLVSKEYPEYNEEMKCFQKYQNNRRATMTYSMLAMKLTGRTVPKYDKKLLKSYSKHSKLKLKLSIFKGTLKRIKDGKMDM